MILRRALPFRQGLLNDDVDRTPIFRVHADQAGMLRSLAHGPKDRGIVQHKHAGISHEQLETRHAFANELTHFFELRAPEVRNDAVEGIVGDRFGLRFLHPGVKSLSQRLPFVLDRKIDQRGGAAESCRDRATLEIVCAGSSAKRHIEVGMHVNAAGDDEVIRGVDHAASILDGQPCTDCRDFVTRDADIRDGCVGGGHYRAVPDNGVKTHLRPRPKLWIWKQACSAEEHPERRCPRFVPRRRTSNIC